MIRSPLLPPRPRSSAPRRGIQRFAALLVAIGPATAVGALPRAAVIERLDLSDAAPGARIEITVDRPLAWTVGREADGRLRIAVPNARPGYGVVSRIVPGGLVEEIRIVAAGVPSRPLTHIFVATRGVADHRFDVDGSRLLLELVPTGLAFPRVEREPEPAAPAPPASAPQPPVAPAESEPSVEEVPEPEPLAPAVVMPLAPAPAASPVPVEAPPGGLTPSVPPLEIEVSTDEPVAALGEPTDDAGELAPTPSPSPSGALLAATPIEPADNDAGEAVAPIEPAPVDTIEEWDLDPPAELASAGQASPQERLVLELEPRQAAETTPPLTSEAQPDPAAATALEPAPRPIDAAPDAEPVVEPPADPVEIEATPADSANRQVEPPISVVPPAAAPSSLPLLDQATQLLTIVSLAPGVIAIAGDGGFEFTGFRLESPERFVIDLHGVVNHSDLGALALDQGILVRVRVSQYRTSPTPITRVIFDLRAPTVPAIESAADGLLVRFALPPTGARPPS